MELMFLGAAREVTGSKYLLTANGRHILVDCGMEQGRDTFENQKMPLAPSAVDCVVLTHAHIDHAGMLPALYKSGFRGEIHATPATTQLCGIMLRDSAHIQEMEAEWRNRKAKRAGEAPYVPLYTGEDAENTLNLFSPLHYTEKREIEPGCVLSFTDAGHLLGSASATLTLTEEGRQQRVVFSGDIGNVSQPMLKDPQYLEHADFVVMESTYGERLHGDRPDYIRDLVDCLQITFDRGGNVVIPSFAVGRSQEILYFLREIKEKGLVKGHDGFPVYLDSPLAIKATRIFMDCEGDCYDEEMKQILREGRNPISFDDLQLSITADDSKAINYERRPCVIISASGMAEAGRIRHHLKHNLWRAESTILFVGYQADGTLGRQIFEGAKSVTLFGEKVAVRAEIRGLKAISGHADQEGLIKWVNGFDPKPRRVFITHGDEDSALFFEELLKDRGFDTHVPYNGDVWSLSKDHLQEAGPRTLVSKAAQKKRKDAKADSALSQALARLTQLVNDNDGSSNKWKDKLAKQINDLIKRGEK